MVITQEFFWVIFKIVCFWHFFTWIYSVFLSAAFVLAENDGNSTMSDGLESKMESSL